MTWVRETGKALKGERGGGEGGGGREEEREVDSLPHSKHVHDPD